MNQNDDSADSAAGTGRRVVMITGASAGVGRATAIAFARKGATVGLIARGKSGLESAKAEVEAAGGTGYSYQADVADYDAVATAAREFEEAAGAIDVWVNNAMVSVFSPVKEMRPEEYRRVIEVNFLGYVHGTLIALERMLPRDEGTIVQVASALSYRGIPLQSAYCASKHAIQGFNDSLRCELRHDGSRVRVTSIDLAAMNTPQFTWSLSRMPFKAQPVPPIYEPEVAAKAIVWASEHRPRELNVGWPTTLTKFANSVFPGLTDRYLAKTGYSSQMTDEPDTHAEESNLWQPRDCDPGAHGPFDDRAHSHSPQLWLATHGRTAMAGLVGAAAMGSAAAAWMRHQGSDAS